jgi:hypothetical protein
VQKFITIFVLSLVVSNYTKAQHCPWDGSSFIMIDPPADIRIISIHLVDSTGAKVISNWYSGPDNPRVDTARFWKNDEIDPQENTLNRRAYHFSFAKNFYVLSFGQFQREMKYQLSMLYEKNNKTHKTYYPLSKENIHILCTDNKELWGGKIPPLKPLL